MVIDDKFDLVYNSEPESIDDKIQYRAFKGVKDFAGNNGIPIVSITKTDDAEELRETIKRYDNIRLLALDLDLNNDGDVLPEDDYLTVKLIIKTAIDKFGYFLLMINSAHASKWKNIAKEMADEINPNFLNNLTHIFDKTSTDNAYDAINKIGENYSLEIIYHFESNLNEARDKAFNNYFDFEKESWHKIYLNLKHETGLMVHNQITEILFATIKQYLINSKYPDIGGDPNKFEEDTEIKKLVFETINYTRNTKEQLKGQPIWTGNFYRTNIEGEDRKYALVITPECDIAQNKQLYYKVVYGFEINESTFPKDYKENSDTPLPLFFNRAKRMSKKAFDENYKKLNQYLYLLQHVIDSLIYIDFRDVRSHEKVDLDKWTLLLRINEPLITDILDKYSNLHNRKGLMVL